LPERFEIILSNQAAKYYKKVSKSTAARIDKSFLELEKDPVSSGDIKIISEKPKRFRLRVGNLRIIYCLDLDKRHILVSAVLPRGQAYKKKSIGN